MVESKFKRGEIVTVTTKSGEIKCTGIVRGWDCNLCTFEVEYEIDYYNREKDVCLLSWECQRNGSKSCSPPQSRLS